MKFGDCSRGPKATEELVPNVMRYSVSYELERGSKRPSSRLLRGGPRAMLFASDVPNICTAPAHMLYEPF